jgi:hypothetical protein
MFVCFECCVLSGRGLCDGLITRPEESYRLWCVVVCDLEKLKKEEAMAHDWAPSAIKKILMYEILTHHLRCYVAVRFDNMCGEYY